MTSDKVILIAKIDPKLKEAFYNLVKSKYKGLRGGVSAELEHALAEHLRVEHTQITHTKLNPVEMPMRHQVTNHILEKLKEKGFWNQCGSNALHDIIRDLRGTDERTILKWEKELIRMGRIKRVNASIFELIG